MAVDPLTAARAPSARRASTASAKCGRAQHSKMFLIFFLIVMSCALGLICVASLIQRRDLHLQRLAVRSLHGTADTSALRGPMELAVDAADENQRTSVRWQELGDIHAYECVGWKAQRDCNPDGGDDPPNDRPCNATVHTGESGFCQIRHKHTKELKKVMKMHCDSLRAEVAFRCDEFETLLEYGHKATKYVHDSAFSLEGCRKQLEQDQVRAVAIVKKQNQKKPRYDQIRLGVHMEKDRATEIVPLQSQQPVVLPQSFQRGVVFVVYEKMLQSVYASMRSLRMLGCKLPVELWYMRSETDPTHPLLKELTSKYGAFVREITDSRATRFYTKMYAVFYSAFEEVLLLDADNFAVRDPTYLFDTPEFRETGAIFWPDFWRPKKTMFNIQPTSFVWEVLDLDPVDMFEQESGQVLINRKTHQRALNVLMYYAFHPRIFERLRLAWGDKDLFRFAWLKTGSTFYMIETPPGSAGLKLPDQNIFCGVTMVQHDPTRDIVFLHRNQEKLSSENREKVWTHVQDFRVDKVSLDDYDVRGANGGRYFPQFKRCYGKDIYYEKAFTVRAIEELPFADLEQRLLDYVQEAARIDGTDNDDGFGGENAVDVADN